MLNTMSAAVSMSETEVLQWLTELFEEKPGALNPQTAREDIPTWDSLGVLNLMAGLDEKFGIVLSEQELQSMLRVDDILKVLRQHGKL